MTSIGNLSKWLRVLPLRARIRTVTPRSTSTCAKPPPRKPFAPVTKAFVTLLAPMVSPRLRFDDVLPIGQCVPLHQPADRRGESRIAPPRRQRDGLPEP